MKTPPLHPQATTNQDANALAEKRHERGIFIFLTVFLAPILAGAIVGTYGLVIWLYQMLAGPPSS
jgi:periplasmic nitrate reductase NapE